jgi:aquaporin Z
VDGARPNRAAIHLIVSPTAKPLEISRARSTTAKAKTNSGQSTGILVEIALTAIFVWVILAVSKTGGNAAAAGIALTLVGIHLAGIPFSGASVNPARSFGPAVVSGSVKGLNQLWVYLVFPLVGAIIAWALYRLFPAEDG